MESKHSSLLALILTHFYPGICFLDAHSDFHWICELKKKQQQTNKEFRKYVCFFSHEYHDHLKIFSSIKPNKRQRTCWFLRNKVLASSSMYAFSDSTLHVRARPKIRRYRDRTWLLDICVPIRNGFCGFRTSSSRNFAHQHSQHSRHFLKAHVTAVTHPPTHPC